MEQFFEVLKYTIPGLIVFATAYYMLKLYLDDRRRIDVASLKNEAQRITIPLRLQAYERLMLLCDRASIPNVLLRIRVPGMSVAELRGALLLAISQEFEHNVSQQLYVSGTLWQIINVAKTDTMNIVTQLAEGFAPEADSEPYVAALFDYLDNNDSTSLIKAAIAVRTEAGRLF